MFERPDPAPPPDAVAAYDHRAADLAAQYESVAAEDVHGPVLDLLPATPGAVLDVGAGSGRDAAWLARLGHQVVAVEPSAGMRAEAQRRHADPRIRWVDDRLPGLDRVHRLGLAFDTILLSAVWMHVAPPDRRRAFRKLITLLRPGGRLLLTLRHGPPDPDRAMHPVTRAEVERLAAEHGALVTRAVPLPDRLGRAAVTWEAVAVQLADDGTGALPLIRHIVLNDAKSSTYKLALLRCVARAADAWPGLAQADGDDGVVLPLGLIALCWLRSFLPLVAADLPQTPTSRTGGGLGFVKEAFHRLAGTAPFELRVGATFHGDRAAALRQALRDAAATIATMPARHITYPGGERPVFDVAVRRMARGDDALVVDAPFLWSFGDFRIPTHVWHALTRMNAWIEPALLAEWTRLMQRYLHGQGRAVPEGTIAAALTWLDPARDTAEVRRITAQMLDAGEPIHCVWSGRRLTPRALDVDHALPFAAWPCGDLWNLLPAAARLNRHEKRDRLVSADLLARSRERIADWWERAYVRRSPVLAARFDREAQASLPLDGAPRDGVDVAAVLDALAAKRLVLRVTQQLPEWPGPPPND
ncbi:class I SAM-dependent methyltransferase [Azospirillum soli]|uniref:class I SAM-dependent methyltransferase n=1 Tax=Azospirillum soli TaxID=1304799 RepID=UPI001AE29DDA|nr:SAM-dependent methyltransferase [Azospirillum soli]